MSGKGRSTAALRPSPHRQAGWSLVELLVAVTILALATSVSLMIYDSASRSFKQGENVSEQQQAVRIAFDLLSTDLRAAGFNTNPDGNRARPDEPIEAAYETAVVLRADFDAGDPAESQVPEAGLAGAAFLSVSTGNDEIRAYVLAKSAPDGTRGGPDTLTFDADVDPPKRNGLVRAVPIDDVDLDQLDPPYTLYRITLDDAANPVSTVLVENVRSLRFRYYDRAGQEIAPVGGGDTPLASKLARAEIRRVHVEIEGLTRDPDPAYVDPEDPDLDTRHLRKFMLAGDVTPRNLGVSGLKDFLADDQPPVEPEAPQLFPGHCGGLLVAWAPNPPEDEVAYYKIHYGSSPGNLYGRRSSELHQTFLGGLVDGITYYVRIQAVDAAGNESGLSPLASETTENRNTPRAPQELVATVGSETSRIDLGWSAVRENTTTTPNDPDPLLLRDMAGYRVYRDDNPNFTPDPSSNMIAGEAFVGSLPDPVYVDRQVAGCRPYYYKVTAVDRCAGSGPTTIEESLPSTEVTASALDSGVPPRHPFDEEAFPMPGGPPERVRFKWSPVTVDLDGNPVYIEHYKVFRTQNEFDVDAEGEPILPMPPAGFDPDPLAEIDDGGTEYVDYAPPSYGYVVKAVDGCGRESEYSSVAAPLCRFSGTVVIDAPGDGNTLTGETPVRVKVAPERPDAVFERLELDFFYEGHWEEPVQEERFEGNGPWSLTWDPPPPGEPAGPYIIRAKVYQSSPDLCTQQTSIRVIVAEDP